MFGRLASIVAIGLFSVTAWAIAPRYVVGGNSEEPVVRDMATKLEWQQRDTLSRNVNWKDALYHCEALDYAGQRDWRLPNIRELMTIVDEKKESSPSINTVFFNGFESTMYWTSTTDRKTAANAYVIYFDEANSTVGRGGVTGLPKDSSANVICVRTVQ